MVDLLPHHALVGQGYDQSGSDTTGYDYEVVRLDRHSPIEQAITERYLRRYISDDSTVADIGVGVGHYSEVLARRDCHMHLVDVSQRLLAATTARLEARGLSEHIASVQHASATDLAFLPTGCCDAVLLLGPLYHLGDPSERRQAIAEAARVLRADGLVFAAGINRLALFRDDFQKKPAGVTERAAFYRGVLHDGNFPAPEGGGPSGVHLTTIDEFRAELSTAFTPVVLVGTESFASAIQESFLDLPEADAAMWLDVIEQTGRTVEGLGYADHFLFIGRR
jgi:SAM-dependent methyltransferase